MKIAHFLISTIFGRTFRGPFTASDNCGDASDPVLIENNKVTPDLGCNPFLMDCIFFNHNIVVLLLMLSVDEPLLHWRTEWDGQTFNV